MLPTNENIYEIIIKEIAKIVNHYKFNYDLELNLFLVIHPNGTIQLKNGDYSIVTTDFKQIKTETFSLAVQRFYANDVDKFYIDKITEEFDLHSISRGKLKRIYQILLEE